MRNPVKRLPRGFTMVELMIVVGIIGILASIAIPGYQKLTARSHRSEMLTAINKFKFFFKNTYEGNGSFATSDVLVGSSSQVNPDPATAVVGQGAQWSQKRTGWVDMPFGLDGSIRMRYQFNLLAKDQIEFLACGSFPAFGPNTVVCPGGPGNYFYDEVFNGNGTSTVTEFPPNSF
jgi:prepilin-type N-terminal cleavage/methylation domain-containing protein